MTTKQNTTIVPGIVQTTLAWPSPEERRRAVLANCRAALAYLEAAGLTGWAIEDVSFGDSYLKRKLGEVVETIQVPRIVKASFMATVYVNGIISKKGDKQSPLLALKGARARLLDAAQVVEKIRS